MTVNVNWIVLLSAYEKAASEGDENRVAQGYAVSQRAAVAQHTLEEQQH